ncbi:hypothetical protein EB73_34925 [Mycobacterium sp. SWH-M3]|nr:hypothetical protein EB73_34925 [Mycobacterium sp. SWH-M3]
MRKEWLPVYDAVRTLAGVCDWANTADGQGFSATDASIGHFLAELPPDQWKDTHLSAALGLLPTYRRQLGIDHISDIYTEPTPRDDAATARATVLAQGREHRRKQRRARNSLVDIVEDRVHLRFPYDTELVSASQKIPGRRFHPDTKANSYPLRSLPAVVEFAEAAEIPISPPAREKLAEVLANPQGFEPVHVTLDADTTHIVINADYNRALNAGLREANGGSSTWVASRRVHQVSPAAIDARALLDLFDAVGLRVADDAAELLQHHATTPSIHDHIVLAGDRRAIEFVDLPAGRRRTIAGHVRELAGSTWHRGETLGIGLHVAPRAVLDLATEHELNVSDAARQALLDEAANHDLNTLRSVATVGPAVDIDDLGITLLPHQHAGVAYALTHRRLVVADEMGLGKTALSLATAAAAGATPIVVACKPDLVENWLAEIAKVLPGRRVFTARGMTPEPIPPEVEIIVIGLAALGARETPTGENPERFLWAEQILQRRPEALIVDEGHLGKEVSAARSRAMAAIGIDVAARDGIVLDLTGTPLVNRPRELAQQLVTLGVLAPKGEPAQPHHLFGEYGAFLFRYCGPRQDPGGYGWTFDGHSHTEELHQRLRAWGLYLRRGQDALTLPDFQMRVLEIPVADLDATAREKYRLAERNLRQYLAAQARDIAEQLGVDPGNAAVRGQMKARAAEHLVKLNALRQILGEAKMPAISHWVQQHIAVGEKVMIAAHHRPVVTGYAKRFGGLKIQGGQTGPAKEADKHAFQTQPIDTAPAITVAIGAGGVGHTLTAARIGVQAELCWTPGERNQMAKRIHRIGQTRPVTYYVAVVPDTIDAKMWDMLERKQRVLDAVLDGEEFDAEGLAGAADIAWEFATVVIDEAAVA